MTSDFDEMVDRLNAEVMAEMQRTYSGTVIDHSMNPRNLGRIEEADGHAKITGPCGDTMEMYLRIRNDTITCATFMTDGCGTSIASGSMVTEMVKGRAVRQALRITENEVLEALGGLPPSDEHCALLAATTLRAAVGDYLESKGQPWKRLYKTG